jgi:hypothetical protein
MYGKENPVEKKKKSETQIGRKYCEQAICVRKEKKSAAHIGASNKPTSTEKADEHR